MIGDHGYPFSSPANMRSLAGRNGITEAAGNFQRSGFISYRRGQFSVLDQKLVALRFGNVNSRFRYISITATDLHKGFARIYGDRCGRYYLLAFSCRTRCFSPSRRSHR